METESKLARRLAAALTGEVVDDIASRGRYATDASAYHVMPLAVVTPKHAGDVAAVLEVAREEGVPVTPRGAGTSQCGQAINEGIIVDTTRHMDRVLSVDAERRRCIVEPGVVLDDLNRELASTGLWFPVDISTSSRATLGGMAGNNACGGRSLRYGTMRDNVSAIDGLLASGESIRFGDSAPVTDNQLAGDLLALGTDIADEVAARFPQVQRRVGGYNLDALTPAAAPVNLAHLLVGSEGTLAFSTEIELQLAPRLGPRVMGVCHFGSFHTAMEAAQHLVKLGPIALELVDRTMLDLGRAIPIYAETIGDVVRGDPAAILIAEFAEDETANISRLRDLVDAMADLGLDWTGTANRWGGVEPIVEPHRQAALTEMRKAGLNIMMSMKDAGKPVSFVEDCAVPLEHLADYTARLTDLFTQHGTTGTWYAHASVGCLHVRPILNLKLDQDLAKMRGIAEGAFALVREYKGSHSGEHGDGIVRSEFHETMFGRKIVTAFETVKERFDPDGLMNPGRIVHPPKFDDRRLLRFGPSYGESDVTPALDWSAWTGSACGLQGAAEMCNNNGACRKSTGGVMCPSWRVTRDERHSVRGRANTLRLALSGQIDGEGLASNALADAMELCVSCKACRRECPTGVDMARMKIEIQTARSEKHGMSLRDRIFAFYPRYAPVLAAMPWALGLRNLPGVARLSERLLGISRQRSLPKMTSARLAAEHGPVGPEDGLPVAMFADCFNRWSEPEVLNDATQVLAAGGYRVSPLLAGDGSHRPLCCGRSYLSVGRIDLARRELERTAAAVDRLAADNIPVVGLEPSCTLTFRDELSALFPGEASARVAASTFLLDEFLAEQADNLHLPLKDIAGHALVHGHCHQKSFGVADVTNTVLGLIPGLDVEPIESGCCGMAGDFGYRAETFEISKAMGEAALLPAVREADVGTIIVASGTSCRHQIRDGAKRIVSHPAQVLARALAPETSAL